MIEIETELICKSVLYITMDTKYYIDAKLAVVIINNVIFYAARDAFIFAEVPAFRRDRHRPESTPPSYVAGAWDRIFVHLSGILIIARDIELSLSFHRSPYFTRVRYFQANVRRRREPSEIGSSTASRHVTFEPTCAAALLGTRELNNP